VTFARRAFAVLWKDVLVERRSKETLNALFFFSLLLLFVFEFALGPDRERLAAVLPGLLWLGFILSGLLGLGRSFLGERENDCWEALLLAPGDKSAIYLGKLCGNLALMLLVEAILLVLFAVFFNLDLAGALPGLAVVVLLGTVGLAAAGTLFAAMTAQVRARELLFPVLLLPVQHLGLETHGVVAALLGIVGPRDDVGHVEERVPLEADVDKCRLHPRQDAIHAAEIDVADEAAVGDALDLDLGDLAVLEDRDTGLLRRRVDEDLARHPASTAAAGLAADGRSRRRRTRVRGIALPASARTSSSGRAPKPARRSRCSI
jgi:heme exporter protein B